jgi:hypothetical protein
MYAYLLELQATGEAHDLLFLDAEGSAQQARAQAEQNLLQKSRNCVAPVPCPSCGFYQPDMCELLKEKESINAPQLAGALLLMLAFVPLVFESVIGWVLSVLLALSALALLTHGYRVAFRFNPNAGDPEARKALGQSQAVWGEPLAELLVASLDAGPEAPLDGVDPAAGTSGHGEETPPGECSRPLPS